MSKERELLNLCAVAFKARNICPFLLTEISELLAQPEHIADVGNMVVQDPVAWKVIDGTNGNYMFSRIKPTERSYKYDVVIPLYTAPPKREPLSDKEITKNTPKLIHIGERLAFHAGVRFAEKHHGIGGEE